LDQTNALLQKLKDATAAKSSTPSAADQGLDLLNEKSGRVTDIAEQQANTVIQNAERERNKKTTEQNYKNKLLVTPIDIPTDEVLSPIDDGIHFESPFNGKPLDAPAIPAPVIPAPIDTPTSPADSINSIPSTLKFDDDGAVGVPPPPVPGFNEDVGGDKQKSKGDDSAASSVPSTGSDATSPAVPDRGASAPSKGKDSGSESPAKDDKKDSSKRSAANKSVAKKGKDGKGKGKDGNGKGKDGKGKGKGGKGKGKGGKGKGKGGKGTGKVGKNAPSQSGKSGKSSDKKPFAKPSNNKNPSNKKPSGKNSAGKSSKKPSSGGKKAKPSQGKTGKQGKGSKPTAAGQSVKSLTQMSANGNSGKNAKAVNKAGKSPASVPHGVPPSALDFIKKLEGLPVKNTLAQDLQSKILPVCQKIPTWNQMNDNQKTAILSFAYSVGPGFYGNPAYSSITKALLSTKSFALVPQALALYDNSGSKMAGLLKARRIAEGKLFSAPFLVKKAGVAKF
jgi:hypothetical protein